MKSGYALLFLLLPFIFSCNKGGSDPTPPPSPNFKITGVKDADLSTTSTGSYTFPITVEALSGKPADTVFLYATDVPGGVYVDFAPIQGITPFTSKVTVSALYVPGGGSHDIKINGAGHSGVATYGVKVTLPAFRGWQLGNDVYTRAKTEKFAGDATNPPTITAVANGGSIMILTFPLGESLPTSDKKYTIASKAIGADRMAITIYDGSKIYKSTGSSTSGGSVTGSFTYDAVNKFTFNCTNIEMKDSTGTKPLTCSFSE